MEPPQVRRLGFDHDSIERGLRRQRSLAYVSCLHVGCESTRRGTAGGRHESASPRLSQPTHHGAKMR